MSDIEIDFEMDTEMPLLLGYVDEDGDFNVQIDTDQLENAQNAGIILAAIEQHLAGALAHSGAAPSPEAALADLRAAYAAECAEQTNENTGGMI